MNNSLFMFKSIWLAEDDPDDVEIFEGVLFDILPEANLTVFPSGEELINELLNGELPDLFILDLNMPGTDGFQCLREIRKTLHIRRVPVVVYTSSPNDKDVMKSYGLGANLFIKKPSRFSEIKATISQVFNMNWEDPEEITNSMFVEGRYIPFKAVI
jgi:CheY-like chemotaxis protein